MDNTPKAGIWRWISAVFLILLAIGSCMALRTAQRNHKDQDQKYRATLASKRSYDAQMKDNKIALANITKDPQKKVMQDQGRSIAGINTILNQYFHAYYDFHDVPSFNNRGKLAKAVATDDVMKGNFKTADKNTAGTLENLKMHSYIIGNANIFINNVNDNEIKGSTIIQHAVQNQDRGAAKAYTYYEFTIDRQQNKLTQLSKGYTVYNSQEMNQSMGN